jgi:metal-sulfur cluster biosynthetic enzyme
MEQRYFEAVSREAAAECSPQRKLWVGNREATKLRRGERDQTLPLCGTLNAEGTPMPAVTEQDVLSALKSCYDPEIPVNIVDLGLIYTVNFAPVAADTPEQAKQDVTVDMTLTSQGCPEHVNISAQVKSRLEQLPGIRNAAVNVVWTPPWTPERLSPDAKKQLGIE